MGRNLKRRVDALAGTATGERVVEALNILRATGTAPEGRAGDRAREIWEEAGRRDFIDDVVRNLWCYLTATGKTLIEALHGDYQEELRAGMVDSDR